MAVRERRAINRHAAPKVGKITVRLQVTDMLTLSYAEIKEPARPQVPPSDRAFLLSCGELQFGFLYVTPRHYVLAWPGIFDMLQLEAEALSSLPARLNTAKVYLSGEKEKRVPDTLVRVSLIISHYDKTSLDYEDSLNRYQLADNSDKIRYIAALHPAQSIMFARYDVSRQGIAGPQFLYAFTVDNYQRSIYTKGELSFKVPATEIISAELLMWVINHHTFLKLLYNVDMNQFQEVLTELTQGSTFEEQQAGA